MGPAMFVKWMGILLATIAVTLALSVGNWICGSVAGKQIWAAVVLAISLVCKVGHLFLALHQFRSFNTRLFSNVGFA